MLSLLVACWRENILKVGNDSLIRVFKAWVDPSQSTLFVELHADHIVLRDQTAY